MTNLLRVLVCGDDSSAGAALAAQLVQVSGFEVRHVTTGDTSYVKQGPLVLASSVGASDVAIVVVDANAGVTLATRRQLHLLLALGPEHVVLALNVNPLDYSEAAFQQAQEECQDVARHLRAATVTCIPTYAEAGDNITQPSLRMPWYFGPTLLQSIQSLRGSDQAPHTGLGPPNTELASQFEATIVWTTDRPMLQGRSYPMSVGTTRVSATIAPLKYRIDAGTFQHVPAKTLACGDVGVCNVELGEPIPFGPDLRRFKLLDEAHQTVGIGLLHFALHRSHNVRWQALDVDKASRAILMGQQPCVIWFTGLSGAGKSTIANALDKRLHGLGRHTYLLDGDNVRHGLNKDLGFTDADRVENIRRVAEVARLMVDAGLIVLVSFISPFRSERRMARSLVSEGEFIEVFVDTPLDVAESRDPKGLYRKARRGELKNFTGVDSPYEVPEHAELQLDTTRQTADDCAEQILRHLERAGILRLR